MVLKYGGKKSKKRKNRKDRKTRKAKKGGNNEQILELQQVIEDRYNLYLPEEILKKIKKTILNDYLNKHLEQYKLRDQRYNHLDDRDKNIPEMPQLPILPFRQHERWRPDYRFHKSIHEVA